MSKNSVRSDSHGGGSGGGRGGPKIGEGDWLCSDSTCANWNFAWRTSCNRCGAEKEPSLSGNGGGDSGGSSGSSYSSSKKKKLGQEIGKAMAEKSRGLFSADDWQCNKCGNVNWARRHQCNVCNAPRFGEVEERTGYGGGYNDRGTVEYVERKDSDDEWDEFGRKKKKQKRSDDSSKKRRGRSSDSESEEEPSKKREKSEPKKSRKDSDDERSAKKKEEEEEEDSDEDGDLSKYDLSGWGDEDEEESSAKKC